MGRHRRGRQALTGLTVGVLLGAGALAGCGDDGDDASDTGGVEITGAWARTSPAMADAGAAYLTVTSSTDDRILGASVDASVAGTVELHETVAAEDEMAGGEMAEGDGMGAMTMQPVEAIELPAGDVVALEPGGLHVMLLDLPDPLEVGETFELTLTLEEAGEQTVSVEVRDEAP